MPYKLRKAPKRDLYWVVGPDGKHHSKDPLPKERAEAQRRALYANERKMEGGRRDDRYDDLTRSADDSKLIAGTPPPPPPTPLPRPRHRRWAIVLDDMRRITRYAEGNGVLHLQDDLAPFAIGVGVPRGDITERECEQFWRMVVPHLPMEWKAIMNAIYYPDDPTGLGRGGTGTSLKFSKMVGNDDEGNLTLQRVINRQKEEMGYTTRRVNGRRVSYLNFDLLPEDEKQAFIDLWTEGYNAAHQRHRGHRSGMVYIKSFEPLLIDPQTARINRGGNHHALHGAGPLPELSILQQIAKAAYSTSPPADIGPFKLRSYTPTLKFYVLPDEDRRFTDTVVVGIRGTNTSDKQDIYADAKLGLGQLEDTPRWKKDLADFNSFMSRIPNKADVDVYGVGHSLGGAVLDMFLKKGLIRQGVSYNPAISLGDAQKDIPNRRIYQDGDPLLAIMGRSAKNVEIRPKKVKQQSVGRRVANAFSYFIPYVGLITKGMDTLDAHALDNFIGGTHRTSVIKKLGLKDEGHSLTELAKASKIPRKTLQEVYNRGIGAYTTNPSSVRMKGSYKKGVDAPMSQKLSKEQWAMARVYSFIDGNPKHDTDLRDKKKVGGAYYAGPYEYDGKTYESAVFKNGPEKNDIITKDDITILLNKLLLDNKTNDKDVESGDVGNWVNEFRALLDRWKNSDDLEISWADLKNQSKDYPHPNVFVVADNKHDKDLLVRTLLKGLNDFMKVWRGGGDKSSAYLRQARAKAKAYGLDPKKLKLATDGKHKLDYDGVKFGLKHYNDFLLWSAEEKAGRVPKGTAEKKRKLYRARAEKIKGEWKANKVSPNNLAIHILW